ncbi:unnamed protein product [Closterium sp. NIES-64]|nr:unnamed protein product [Closterium sp. NIES-64]
MPFCRLDRYLIAAIHYTHSSLLPHSLAQISLCSPSFPFDLVPDISQLEVPGLLCKPWRAFLLAFSKLQATRLGG